MAKQPSKKKRTSKKRKKKLSRFNISRSGELLMAGVGVVLIVGIGAIILWMTFSGKLIKKSPEAVAKEKAETTRFETDWKVFSSGDVFVSAAPEQENIYVSGEKWKALFVGKRGDYAAAAAHHFGISRCFIYDVGSDKELGWYTTSGGYRDTDREPGGS